MTTQLHQSEKRPQDRLLTLRNNILHITRGPDVRTPLGEFETRWCFKCRKRTEHEWIKWSESRADSPYEPNFVLTCSGCDESHIYFPGCEPW